MSDPQTLPQFPQRDYTDPTRANPVGTLWADSPDIRGIDCHVAGVVPATSKTITATAVGFTGGPVGFVIAGITYSIDATTAADFVAQWNALPTHAAVATASLADATNVQLVILGYGNPTITSYSPGVPDFTPITVVTEGSDPAYIAAGTAVIRDYDPNFGGVTIPNSSSVGADIYGVALRSNLHTVFEGEMLGWDASRGAWPGSHLRVIPGGYPKVALAPGGGAALAGGAVYCVKSGAHAGKFRATADASAVLVPNSRWGRPYAATATVGHLELHIA